jgi:hypothetical protein
VSPTDWEIAGSGRFGAEGDTVVEQNPATKPIIRQIIASFTIDDRSDQTFIPSSGTRGAGETWCVVRGAVYSEARRHRLTGLTDRSA